MAKFITLTLKGANAAIETLDGLQQMQKTVLMPGLRWLEDELTTAFGEVIGPASPLHYKGVLWAGLHSSVDETSLKFYERAPHGPFVRAGTYPYRGGGREGGYERLKTWAEEKLGVGPAAQSRIAWFTLLRGTFRATPYRYPPGKRRYDYPLRVVEVEGKPALDRAAEKLGEIIVKYIDSKRAPIGYR